MGTSNNSHDRGSQHSIKVSPPRLNDLVVFHIKKSAKRLLMFAVFCVIALPIIIVSSQPFNSTKAVICEAQADTLDFDHNGKIVFDTYDDTTSMYMSGNSTARTLDYYYSLRQYPGSPPFITHELLDENDQPYECLSCHAKGGFTQSMGKNAPVTPHPQHTECQQCHVKPLTKVLFKGTDWSSVQPPKLGRSELPGSPPAIAHPLQMRENCVACHVGPGAVATIRVEHPMRGNCRQCHVPKEVDGIFESKIKTDQ